MNATLPAPDLPTLAPAFAGRFALIIAGLVALIARAFLRHPGLAPLILPLCRRLGRNARRLSALMARLADDQPPRRHRPGRSGGLGLPIPTTRAWLVRTLRHDAASYASQLSHLLNEPGIPELLAAAPTTGRLLRPLCRMLGVSTTALPALAPRANRVFAVKNPECPDTASSAVAPQATGVFPSKNPESTAASLAPAPRPPPLPPPPCPHVGWPWFPRAQNPPETSTG